MGIQTMASQGKGQQSHFHPSPLARQNSWYNMTLDEVNSQLGDLGKPLGSMDLHELLQSIYTSEATKQPVKGKAEESNASASSLLQRQASLSLARAFGAKTVDDVWREIQIGQKKRHVEEVKLPEREPTLGETTLEDFLVQAGLFAEASPSVVMRSDSVDGNHKFGVSSVSPSVGTLSDQSMPGRKRDGPDWYERTMERRLRRKIKNRESAARSRARKQAYHNELVNKVSRLEEDNLKLKKEKEFENKLVFESSEEPKYQLRRTSSASF